MSNIDVEFCRMLMVSTHKLVRERFPDIKVSEAGVTESSVGGTNRYWLFEYMVEGTGLFTWEGTAHNAYDARSKGWHSFINKYAPETPVTTSPSQEA